LPIKFDKASDTEVYDDHGLGLSNIGFESYQKHACSANISRCYLTSIIAC